MTPLIIQSGSTKTAKAAPNPITENSSAFENRLIIPKVSSSSLPLGTDRRPN